MKMYISDKFSWSLQEAQSQHCHKHLPGANAVILTTPKQHLSHTMPKVAF